MLRKIVLLRISVKRTWTTEGTTSLSVGLMFVKISIGDTYRYQHSKSNFSARMQHVKPHRPED